MIHGFKSVQAVWQMLFYTCQDIGNTVWKGSCTSFFPTTVLTAEEVLSAIV